MSVDGGVVKGRVLLQPLNVDVGSRLQQLLGHGEPAAVAGFMERRPA